MLLLVTEIGTGLGLTKDVLLDGQIGNPIMRHQIVVVRIEELLAQDGTVSLPILNMRLNF